MLMVTSFVRWLLSGVFEEACVLNRGIAIDKIIDLDIPVIRVHIFPDYVAMQYMSNPKNL